jgi:hypothetical protein
MDRALASLQKKQTNPQRAEHNSNDDCLVVVCGQAVTNAVRHRDEQADTQQQ